MFERDIYNQLQKWAERTGRKPLVLRGARQVGKTTLVNEFARNFENYLHLNLEREEDARLFQSTDKSTGNNEDSLFSKEYSSA